MFSENIYKMKNITSTHGIVAAIIILIILVVYHNYDKQNITTQGSIKDYQEEILNEELQEESKNVELSQEDAYYLLNSYNKIYNWKHMLVVDNNYEPAKKYSYDNPTLRISPNKIILNSDIYNVIEYKITKSKGTTDRLGSGVFEDPSKTYKETIESITIQFIVVGAEATFHHTCTYNGGYSFVFKSDNLINTYCADEEMLRFYSFFD